ncbi:hypothetical protein Franean1_3630 [Parafrankia sp. EAN1pec]|uniref:hypothetical protein n=1 Tax=Parafrankia sp. (strain EAN1pec) TaxID=298653 RepID=UPI00005446EF|nr:hypothetical protein Franean1_3630 [Frankia sp. EAN1pec]
MTAQDSDADALPRVSARIYRQNAFRVTGLPLSSTGRDIRRKADMLAVIEKTGGQIPTSDILPLRPAPSAGDVRAALDRLGDPRQRLVDEFFWFWPAESGAAWDEGIAALAAGDPDAALRHWTAAAVSGTGAAPGDADTSGDADTPGEPAAPSEPVAAGDAASAVHNIAVLEHLRALEVEMGAEGEQPDWASVYRRWGHVLHDDRVWDSLVARIRRAADARLDVGLAPRIRAALPGALLSIGAEIVVAAIGDGDDDRAERQLTAMRAAQLGDGAREALGTALRAAGEPWADQVGELCEEAVRLATDTRAAGLDQAAHILDHSAGPLARLDRMLAPDDSTRVRTHDKVALDALRCLLLFDQARDTSDASAARDHLRMIEVITRAERAAASEAVRGRLAENREILDKASVRLTCWICHEKPADPGAAITRWMHGDVVRTVRELRWNKVEVTVPRCRSCQRGERDRGWLAALRCALYFVVAISLPTMLFTSAGGGYIFLAVLVAFFALIVDLNVVVGSAGRRQREHIDLFPPIVELREKGWRNGERPLGVGGA